MGGEGKGSQKEQTRWRRRKWWGETPSETKEAVGRVRRGEKKKRWEERRAPHLTAARLIVIDSHNVTAESAVQAARPIGVKHLLLALVRVPKVL